MPGTRFPPSKKGGQGGFPALNAPHPQDPLSTALSLWQQGNPAVCLATLDAQPSAWQSRPDAWNLRGVALKSLNRLPDAERAYRQALALKPDYAEAWQNLGNLYAAAGQHAAALEAYAQAAAPSRAPAERAAVLGAASASAFALGETEAALAAAREAVALAPASGAALNQLGKLLWELGHVEPAVEAFGRAAAVEPGNALYATNRLLVSQFSEACDEAALSRLARESAVRIESGVPAALREAWRTPPAPQPGERIRIGYLSSDFRASAPGFFIRSILAGHDRARFEVHALSTSPGGDHWTGELRSLVYGWHEVAALDSAALVERLRGLRLHVLVDLNGYTGGHRLAAFAARCAPLQVSWLGYEGSTQLANMDLFLGDTDSVPPGNEAFYSERVARLPFSFACYAPPDYAPPVAQPPVLRNGHVTFGSFNKLAKLGPATIALWAKVLAAVPGSRLLIKWRHAPRPAARERIATGFASHGIDPARLEFRDATPHSQMLAEYGDVDIALDPLPFSGGATTCEALWMGVPVVTLKGSRFASNHTATHLRAAGVPEWVTHDAAGYVACCARLARDPAGLALWREGARAQIAASPLGNARLFVGPVERVFAHELSRMGQVAV